ncbi:MAG: CPBP family intramembrane glutamic endopeptidase, partial [Candidatus Odinarchaeota archaeon]
LGIYLTIALPEELIMRAYILNAWDTQVAKENNQLLVVNLLVVSFVFGLSHWNNVDTSMVPWYVLLATIAGIVYGIAWRKGRLHEAMIVHAMVDWIWSYFFKI